MGRMLSAVYHRSARRLTRYHAKVWINRRYTYSIGLKSYSSKSHSIPPAKILYNVSFQTPSPARMELCKSWTRHTEYHCLNFGWLFTCRTCLSHSFSRGKFRGYRVQPATAETKSLSCFKYQVSCRKINRITTNGVSIWENTNSDISSEKK